jgi:hypothetical protein
MQTPVLQAGHSNVWRSSPCLFAAAIHTRRIIASQFGQIGRSISPSGRPIVSKGAILFLADAQIASHDRCSQTGIEII